MPRAGMVGSKMIGTQVTALSDAKVGNTGIVESIDLPEEVSNYLAHLGFLPGTRVEVLRRAPAGDPTVYRIDGVEVGLRNETARHIFLKLTAGVAQHATNLKERPEQAVIDRALTDLLHNIQLAHCTTNMGYLRALLPTTPIDEHTSH